MHRLAVMLLAVLSAAALGCAARHEASQVPSAPEAPGAQGSPTSLTEEQNEQDIDELEAALNRDEQQLHTILPSSAEQPPPSQPRSSAPPAPESVQLKESPSCARACRSLASMQRSAEGICRLAGEKHERCERARQRIESAESSIHAAGCAC